MVKQFKINFSEKETDLYNHISKKTSKGAYIKDLIRIDMEREQNYINGVFESRVQASNTSPKVKEDKPKDNNKEYIFSLEDLGI